MGDPVSDRSYYLAIGGEGTGDLFLIQAGGVEHLGLLRSVRRRAALVARADEAAQPASRSSGVVGRTVACAVALILAVVA